MAALVTLKYFSHRSFHSENVKDIKRIRKRSKKKETDLRAKIQVTFEKQYLLLKSSIKSSSFF